MHIYVAGKFEEADIVRDLYARLQEMGHTITHDWTGHIKSKPFRDHTERIRQYALNEVNAILRADAIIYLTHERGTTLHMEFGAAVAKAAAGGEMQILIVGEHNERSPWYFLPFVTRVASIDEALEHLAT